MSTVKKADHREVQPSAKHYIPRVRPDGKTDNVLVGPYTLDQRDRFFDLQIDLIKTRNPEVTEAQARTLAFQKWRNLVFATLDAQWRREHTVHLTAPKEHSNGK